LRLVHLFIQWFIISWFIIHCLINLLIFRSFYSPIYSSLIHLFIVSLMHWINWLDHWFTDFQIHWFIDSLVYWFIDSFFKLFHYFIDLMFHWFSDKLMYFCLDSLISKSIGLPLIHYSFLDSQIQTYFRISLLKIT